MKNPLPKTVALSFLMSCAARLAPVSAQPIVAAPKAPALEIQISAPIAENGDRFLILDSIRPHISVVLRNTSNRPIQLFQEWNSWGYYNLHLEIAAIDGKKLPQTLVIAKGSRAWRANFPSIETLGAHQTLVREAYLHLPIRAQHSEKSVPVPYLRLGTALPADQYGIFPFPANRDRETIAMKAVFEVKPQSKKIPVTWTGHIESKPFTYQILRTAPRL